MFKNSRWSNVHYTKSKRLYSPWIACFVFDWKYLFCVCLVKTKNYQFKLKFGTKTDSNMQNSMMMFTLYVLDHKYPTWANLVQKFKDLCSKWSLIQGLILTCRIQWWCLFYPAFDRKYPFFGIFFQKSKLFV